MRTKRIPLNHYMTNEEYVILEDSDTGSRATYTANNPNKRLLTFYKPDKENSPEPKQPRCDFILEDESDSNFPIRFIELKGVDCIPDKTICSNGCTEKWNHGFHQLYCTYRAIETYMEQSETKFILCTSATKPKVMRTRNGYLQYRWYQRLRAELKAEVLIFYPGDYDTF